MFKSWCIQVVFVHVNMCATVCVSKLFFCVRGYVILLIDFLLYICWQQLHLYHLYELYKSLSWKNVLFIYSFWLTHFLVLAFPHTVGDIGNMQPEVHRDQDKLFEIQDGPSCSSLTSQTLWISQQHTHSLDVGITWHSPHWHLYDV